MFKQISNDRAVLREPEINLKHNPLIALLHIAIKILYKKFSILNFRIKDHSNRSIKMILRTDLFHELFKKINVINRLMKANLFKK